MFYLLLAEARGEVGIREDLLVVAGDLFRVSARHSEEVRRAQREHTQGQPARPVLGETAMMFVRGVE